MEEDERILVLWREKGYGIPPEQRSEAQNRRDQQEEDLHFGARDTLKRAVDELMKRGASAVDALRVSYHPVAEWFRVNKDELLTVFVRHYLDLFTPPKPRRKR